MKIYVVTRTHWRSYGDEFDKVFLSLNKAKEYIANLPKDDYMYDIQEVSPEE